jgi:hypothetical protein
MAVHGGTPKRTLLNFMQQAAGGDCMRLAGIAGHEAGIQINAPSHDAFWISAPSGELDDAIETMRRFMVRASAVVTGGLEINPVRLTYQSQKAIGLSRFATMRALRRLELEGVVSIERHRGRAPLVTHRWFPTS